MSIAKGIVKNVGALLFADIITSTFSLALVFFIARSLGDVGLGKYSFALAFASIFVVFSEFGVLTYVVREIAANKDRAQLLVANVMGMKLIFGLLTLVLSIVAIISVGESPEVIRIVAIAAVAMFFNYFGYIFRAIFQAFEVMHYDAVVKIIERVLAAVLGIGALFAGFGVEGVLIASLSSFIIAWALGASLASRKVTRLSFAFDLKSWRLILIGAFPFWLTSAFTYIYFRIDTVMLSFISGFDVVGWYNAANKVVEALAFIPTLIVMAVFPVFSRLFSTKDTKSLSLLLNKTFYYLICIGAPVSVGGWFVAGRIVGFVYGDVFVNSIVPLQILFITLFFIFSNGVLGYFLNAIGRGYHFTVTALLAAIANIIANLLLIPSYGANGAAWATVITHVLGFIVLVFFVLRAGFRIQMLPLVRPLFATAIMALGVNIFGNGHLFLVIPLAVIVYSAILLLIRGIDRDDIDVVLSVLSKRVPGK